MSEDLIRREDAYAVLSEYYHHKTDMQHKVLREALDRVPSATQTNDSNALNALDCISRQAAIDEVCKMMYECFGADEEELDAIEVTLHELPSAQPEPLSDAYMKAVWTWLLDYQLKAVEMEGKYTPYEVLSWVVNDWRKEHGSN